MLCSGVESGASRGRRMRGRCLRAALLASSALIAAALPAAAQDATWNLNGTGNFNLAANWTPATVPTGTAFFGASNQNNVSFLANATIGGWTFNAGASNYTFTLLGPVLTFNGAGIVINGGSVTINNTFGGVVFDNTSTAGSATINNASVVQFSANSTAGSATITNNGPLRFFGTSTAGSATITNNENTSFQDSSTAGSATITNNNFMIFFNTSSAGSATITNNSSLFFTGSSTVGSATITNNLSVDFNTSSKAGNATITNNNFMQFRDTSTAENATIINNDSLVFRDTSTAGNAAITNNGSVGFLTTSTAGNAIITNNANLSFAQGSKAGSATLITNGGGSTTFVSSSSADQARFITNAGGVVDISFLLGAGTTAGSIEGAGSYRLGSKSFTVGSNNLSTTVTGVISDGGNGGGVGASLTKVGSGALTLAGTNTYTGATTVDAGALLVNGSIASSILTTVNAGGTLGGTGTVGSTTINNGGALSPGNSVGTLTVQGNLVMASAAAYLVEVSGSAADRTNVSGTATLGGAVQVLVGAGGFARSYTILHADGGLGGSTFGGVSVNNPNLIGSLSYTAIDVILGFTANLGGSTPGLSGNQQGVASAINGFFNNGGTLPANFSALFGLTGVNLANALTLLSGEVATGAQQGAFQLNNQFLGMMLDPFVDGRTGVGGAGGQAIGFAPERAEMPEDLALAYAKVTKTPVYKAPVYAPSFEQRWSVWGGGYGGTNKTSGDPLVVGSHDLTARTAGFAAGLDYAVAPGTVVGFALAGGGTNWGLANGLGTGKSDAFQAGLYGSTRWGALYVAAALAYAWHDVSTDRFAFVGNHLTASFDAQSIAGRVEAGYRMGSSVAAIIPYAAMQAQNFRTPSYVETDVNLGGFGLGYNSRNGTATRSEFGARADQLFALNPSAVLALRGRLAWAHDWVSDPSLAAGFQTLPGASFIVNGATPAKDLALVSAGAELRLANGVTLSGKFDGEFAERSTTYAGTGTVRFTW
jgi:autotransporter-associated beta strand protein